MNVAFLEYVTGALYGAGAADRVLENKTEMKD
ncbi:MAG: hypothetical protein ACI93R_001002 [Flavobacteriales bacterium]|jgi:hypothetical protein